MNRISGTAEPVQQAVRLVPVGIDVLFSGLPAQRSDRVAQRADIRRIRFREGGKHGGPDTGAVQPVKDADIGCDCPRDVIIGSLDIGSLDRAEENGHVLVHPGIIAFPAQPAVFAGLQSGHDGGGCGNCGGKEHGLIDAGQAGTESSVLFQVAFQDVFAHAVQQDDDDVPVILFQIPVKQRKGISGGSDAEFPENGVGQVRDAVFVVGPDQFLIHGGFLLPIWKKAVHPARMSGLLSAK